MNKPKPCLFHQWTKWSNVKADVRNSETKKKVTFACAYKFCKVCSKFKVKPS